MGVRAPAPLRVRALPTPGVRAQLGVRALAPMGVRAPAPLGPRPTCAGPSRHSMPAVARHRGLGSRRLPADTLSPCAPPVAAPILGKRIARVQAPPAAMLAGPLKRTRAGEPTMAAAVLQACKAVFALDPVVSGKAAHCYAVGRRRTFHFAWCWLAPFVFPNPFHKVTLGSNLAPSPLTNRGPVSWFRAGRAPLPHGARLADSCV
jgi:hypothetical protein